MDRRNFIRSATAVGLGACLPLSLLSFSPGASYQLGYQLYSIRDAMEKDPMGTIQSLHKMGYQHFEHYGFNAEQRTYYGMKPRQFKRILDGLGLSVSSGHYPFANYLDQPLDQLLDYTDICIEGALALGSSYLVWPWLAPEQRNREGFQKTAQCLNRVGERVNAAGLGFAYHNHGFDFHDLDGTTGYEIILTETDPELVKLQLDLYWVMHSSARSPAEWIEQAPGRFTLWHLKDMHKETRDYTELGNGSIDYPKILPDPQHSGLQYFYLEQGGNYTKNSLESAAVSAAYYKTHIQQFF